MAYLKILGPLVVLACFVSPALAQDDSNCHVGINGDHTANISAECERALAEAQNDADRAQLLFRMAVSLVDRQEVLAALPLLDRAVALVPTNGWIFGVRASIVARTGNLSRALEDFDHALELAPEAATLLAGRSVVRRSIGDFTGALDDVRASINAGDDTPTLRLAMAGDLIWLDRLDEAEAELFRASADPTARTQISELRTLIIRRRAYVPDGQEAERCRLDMSTNTVAEAEQMIDICTHAYMAHPDPARRASFLTRRSAATLVARQDQASSLRDLQVAAGIYPGSPHVHINLGFALLTGQRSWAARNSFDTALASDQMEGQMRALALGGRAQANQGLGDSVAARSDARDSWRLAANWVAPWVMGSLALGAGDTDSARNFALLQYSLGDRGSDLLGRLRDLGVEDPDAAASELLERCGRASEECF